MGFLHDGPSLDGFLMIARWAEEEQVFPQLFQFTHSG